MGISREGWGLRDETPPNKKKNTNKQEKHLSSKENAFQARGIFQSNVKVYKWQEFPVKARQL